MKTSHLIVITGAPGTGKTTLAKSISDKFSLPLIVKDEIKEILFDSLGWDIPGWDPDSWQKKVGIGSIETLHLFNESLLSKGISHIIESNFVPQFANQRFVELHAKYSFISTQVYVTCQSEILIERFKKRIKDPSRHPGHGEETYLQELTNALKTNRFGKLDLGGEIIEIDTTDFTKIEYDGIYNKISSLIT